MQSSPEVVMKKAMKTFENMSISDSTSSSSLTQASVKIRAVLEYIDAVKARFMEDEPEVYDEFLELMKAFKSQQSVILLWVHLPRQVYQISV
jgi:histone deacetylase complex regulatory component SIN3